MDEERVYYRLREGDPAALEELMDAYWINVYQLIARILHGLGNSGDIEECCSDAFAAAWDKKEMFDPQRGSLRTGVLILARYLHYPHGDTLRVHVDLGPVGEETLEGFALDIRNGSWAGKYGEVTGQLEYFEVGLDGNLKNMKFTLKDPVYSIEGPWDITFPRE